MTDATEPPGGQQAWPPPVVGAPATVSSAQPWSRDAPRPDVVDRPSSAPATAWAPPMQQTTAPIMAITGKKRPRWPWVVGIAAIAVALLIGAVALAGRKTSQQTTSPASTGPETGELKWDPRIADLAAFVEKSRGLTFKRPVALRLLDDDAWRSSTSRGGTTVNFDIAEALGLFPQGFDARSAANVAQGSAYSAFTEGGTTVNVHGTTLDPFTRAQVVHGLTHALDSQHADTLDHQGSRPSPREARIDYVIFEGDASLVENEWIASLPSDQRTQALDRLEEIEAERNVNASSALLVEWMLPDLLGDEFVHAVAEAGPEERNRLFSNPPQHDAAAFDPSRYTDPIPSPVTETMSGEPGDAPTTAGADPTDGVGSWLWFLTLASVEQPSAVRAAMSAYQADVAVVSRVQDSVCVDAIVVPTPNGADALGAAFEKWAAVDPAHRKTSQRPSGSVRVNSCSTDRPVNPEAVDVHLREFASRNSLAASLVHFRLAPNLRSAVCLAEQAVVRRGFFTVDKALDPPDQPRLATLVEGLDNCPP
jgi:hypothetical protein